MRETAQKMNGNPTLFCVFGATGDLAKSKLLPALLDLYVGGHLPQTFKVVGLSRRKMTDEMYGDLVEQSFEEKGHGHDRETVKNFCKNVHYMQGDLGALKDYEQFGELLKTLDEHIGQCTNKLFYLAVPPDLYGTVFENLANSQLMRLCDGEDSWARLLVEKPFGKDTTTAQELEEKLCDSFDESQIYRIDHYLAKDSIEHIFALRFANSIIKDVWNGKCVERVYVHLCEEKDVANRGSFYDGIGALRDVGANHMLQILALVAMEQGDIQAVDDIRAKRADVFGRLALYDSPERSLLRAQYEGYKETEGVQEDSMTETYFKLKLCLEKEGWDTVPIFLEAGKALQNSSTGVTIYFHAEDDCYCELEDAPHHHTNHIAITFSPKQNISIRLWVKRPGFDFVLEPKDLTMVETEGDMLRSPEAYEKVLYDCIAGDQTRFVSSEEVREAWKLITPILEKWNELPLYLYQSGSEGPQERDTIS